MNIVLVEYFSGDETTAEAFKSLESMREYFLSLFENNGDVNAINQFDDQFSKITKGRGIVDICIIDEGGNAQESIRAYPNYGLI